MVTLVLLSSVFASTVNAILIGLVLCTFSTLMLLLIKCKTTFGLVLQGFCRNVSIGGPVIRRNSTKIKDLNMKPDHEMCLSNLVLPMTSALRTNYQKCLQLFYVYNFCPLYRVACVLQTPSKQEISQRELRYSLILIYSRHQGRNT